MNSNEIFRSPLQLLPNHRVLVMGLGRFGGGVGVTRWLAGQGANVTVADSAPQETLIDSIQAISDLDVKFRFGPHEEKDLEDIDLVIVNPAVKKSVSPFFQEILRRNIPWTTEMNLFCERCPAPVIGVTGTFGKSTTCAMLAAALEKAGNPVGFRRVHLGGNIGKSLLADLQEITEDDIVMLEMSNAQLEDISQIDWRPLLAVITNLEPHHLDRYAAPDDYFLAKLNLIKNGTLSGKVVAGPCHERALMLLKSAISNASLQMVHVSAERPLKLKLPGAHNQQNAACVMTICRELGCDLETVKSALEEFRGLEHRLELVHELRGVTFYNDSKSTAPTATSIALRALLELRDFPKRIVCIVGGQRKQVELAALASEICQVCAAVICMGEAGPDFAAALKASVNLNEKQPDVFITSDLVEAVAKAASYCHAGDTVLLSPGAPSFDQYSNFTERGRHFGELVQKLL